MQGQYNMRSPAVKRLMKEAQELRDPTELYHAQPLEDNLFEWHFTLRGPDDSDFDGGVYHGRIILPPEYPMKPPSIILLTPNGRFETFKKICLSISGHHPESWQPSWSIRTALLAIIGFMPTHGGGAIGSLDYTPEERKVLAKKSQDWKCPDCGDVFQKLKPKTEASDKAAQEAKELASQINFQGEKPGGSPSKTTEDNSTTTATATTPNTTLSDSTTTTTTPPHTQSPFPYPWTIPTGWGTPSQQNPGASTFPRFPYPPPFMMPPPGMFIPPPPASNNTSQGLPGFPPMPFFPPMMRGLLPFPGAAGTLPQTVGTAAGTVTSSSQVSLPGTSTNTTTSTSTATSSATVTTSSTVTATAATSTTAPPSSTKIVGPASSTTSTTASSTSTPASPSAETATTPAANSSATATELRQRTTTIPTSQPQTQQTSPATPVTTSIPTPQTQRPYSREMVVMMVILSLAIFLLLGRRLYMHYFVRDMRSLFD